MDGTVLLVIDAQRAFFGGGGGAPPIPGAAEVLGRIEGLVARARAAGVPVVFVQHQDEEFTAGSPPWELALAPLDGEAVVAKSTPDSFRDTELAAVLERLGAGRLVICGCQTEFCVDTTTRAAASRDYQVTLASDAHGTWDSEVLEAGQIVAHHNGVLRGFARVVPAGEVGF